MTTATAAKPAAQPATGTGITQVWPAFKNAYVSPVTRKPSVSDFRADWQTLPDEDRAQIIAGVTDGSMNYTPTKAQITAAKARVIAVPGGPNWTV